MAKKKISELTVLTTLAAGNIIPIVDSGETKGITITNLFGTIPPSILFTITSFRLATVTKISTDSPYTVLVTDFSIICNAVGGAIVVNLPAATGSGRLLEIKKIDASANLVTPTTNGAELLDGFTTQTLTAQWEAITIQDTASGVWHIL